MADPETFSFFLRGFVVAIGLGALIGLEREHRRGEDKPVIAGVRTFPLFSTSGFLLALIAHEFEGGLALPGALLVATGLGGIMAVALGFLRVRHELGITGLTTPMAMVVTFLVGLLVGFGFEREAIVVGVVTTALLLTKDRLHTFAEILDDQEIMGALQFITVVFILFPIVQDLNPPVLGQDWIGRGALLDPYFTLLVVIFVSAISFVSFIAMRVVGARRGVAVSGLLGGLVNSEATSISVANHARETPALARAGVTAIVLATTTMLVRNLAIAAFTDPSLRVLQGVLPPLALMAATGVGFAAWRFLHREAADGDLPAPRVENPFAIRPAFKFAVIFLALNVLATLAQETLGTYGVYATALGGFVSAGAVVASVAALAAQGAVSVEVAVETAVLASVIGAANKLVILRAVSTDVYERARVPFLALTLVGTLALLVMLVM